MSCHYCSGDGCQKCQGNDPPPIDEIIVDNGEAGPPDPDPVSTTTAPPSP